jgi:hypothetical protein
MTTVCPKGHTSSDADYCSECGTRIGAPGIAAQLASAPATSPVSAPAATTDGACPDCATPRSGGARFCEVCRYDFQTGSGFKATAASAAVAPIINPPIIPAPDAPMATKLSVVVITDPTLVTEPDPDNPCPVGAPERVFPLDLAENLLGRRSVSKDSHPEIPVNDPGVSRRHLKFLRQADDSFQVVDLSSANGLNFNGKTLEPGVQTPIAPGDEITIGMWTRIVIRAR